MKPRVPNVAVKITRNCRLTFEWDEMFARYLIKLSKIKLEQQLCLSAKVNIMHIHRLQCGLQDGYKIEQQLCLAAKVNIMHI